MNRARFDNDEAIADDAKLMILLNISDMARPFRSMFRLRSGERLAVRIGRFSSFDGVIDHGLHYRQRFLRGRR